MSAMLAAMVCGLLCGVRGYVPLVEWLHDLPVDFWHSLGFTRRPPKKDAFRDLLRRLDPDLLEGILADWIREELELDLPQEPLPQEPLPQEPLPQEPLSQEPLSQEPLPQEPVCGVSLDGKTLCGTLQPHARAVHLLSLVDQRTGCVLSQCRVGEKTNEHKTALELLKTIVLKGRVIVGDAAFCQRDLCERIVEAKGDYLFAVKENQPDLRRKIALELTSRDAGFSPLRPAAAAV